MPSGFSTSSPGSRRPSRERSAAPSAALSRTGSGALVVVAGALPDAERTGLAGAAVVGRHSLTLVAMTGGQSTAATGRAGGDVIALDAPEGFAASWNQVMVRRSVARRGTRT